MHKASIFDMDFEVIIVHKGIHHNCTFPSFVLCDSSELYHMITVDLDFSLRQY